MGRNKGREEMKKEKFITRYEDCKKRPCFVPFRGNEVSTCRLYETGQCKDLPVERQVRNEKD